MLVQQDLPIIKRDLMRGKILIASDFHIPFQDNRAVNAFLSYAIDTQPEVIVLNGDLLDFYRLSKFVKSDGRNPREEITEAKIILENLREGCPYSDIYYPIGNHETRLETYILNKAPDIASLVENFHETLDCKKFKVQPCHKVVFNGEIVCKHGNFVSQKAGQTAIKEMDNNYSSGASGHTHRLAKIIRRINGKKYYWLETGCLCTLDPHYMLQPDWVHGLGLFEIDDYKIKRAEVLEIEDGRIL